MPSHECAVICVIINVCFCTILQMCGYQYTLHKCMSLLFAQIQYIAQMYVSFFQIYVSLYKLMAALSHKCICLNENVSNLSNGQIVEWSNCRMVKLSNGQKAKCAEWSNCRMVKLSNGQIVDSTPKKCQVHFLYTQVSLAGKAVKRGLQVSRQ